MQRLDAADIVGLCNDELYRRYCVFPGVYSAPHDDEACCRELHGDSNESDPEKLARLHMAHEEGTALYPACEAQYFHSQLPLSENADCCDAAGLDSGSKRQQEQQQQQKRDHNSNRKKKNVHFQRVCSAWEHGSVFFATSDKEKIERVSRRRGGILLHRAVANGTVERRRGDCFGRV